MHYFLFHFTSGGNQAQTRAVDNPAFDSSKDPDDSYITPFTRDSELYYSTPYNPEYGSNTGPNIPY